MDKAIDGIIGIITAIIGLAVLAVLFSKSSNTGGVISSAAQGFDSILNTALSPITHGSSLVGSSGGVPNIGGGFDPMSMIQQSGAYGSFAQGATQNSGGGGSNSGAALGSLLNGAVQSGALDALMASF